MDQWLEVNRQYAKTWPNITRKGEAPADADEWKDVPDKFAKQFSAAIRENVNKIGRPSSLTALHA